MRVSQNLILLPVFAQVLLIFAVLVAMVVARQSSLKVKGNTIEDAALADDTFWTTQAQKCSNNFKNQFELPLLFFAVCGFALITRMVDVVFLALAIGFVISRIAHTIVHLGSNKMSWRGGSFLIGFVILVVLWVMLFFRVVSAGF